MRISFFIYIFVFAVFAIVSGCGNSSEYETVHFSDTVSASSVHTPGHSNEDALNVAIGAMISPSRTLVNYQELVAYIGKQTGLETRIIQRKTYGEVNELLRTGKIDIAFICTGPYVRGKADIGFEAIATPVVRGEPYYRAYLIVHKESPFQSLEDLKGGIFAFTDPESNTGALVPTSWLKASGQTPEMFFSRIHLTYSHDNSILAVATRLVDAASVDGHIWEYFNEHDPVYTSKTRVIKKSTPFGSPPLVTSAFIDSDLKERITQAVIHMHQDPAGKKILDKLLIDRFDPSREQWYESAAELAKQSNNPWTTDEKH
jgi:phosphonate transport system substrate-binding protein